MVHDALTGVGRLGSSKERTSSILALYLAYYCPPSLLYTLATALSSCSAHACTCCPQTISSRDGEQDWLCLARPIQSTGICDQSTMSKENIVGERRSRLCPPCVP